MQFSPAAADGLDYRLGPRSSRPASLLLLVTDRSYRKGILMNGERRGFGMGRKLGPGNVTFPFAC
jgi:hypothetical protein